MWCVVAVGRQQPVRDTAGAGLRVRSAQCDAGVMRHGVRRVMMVVRVNGVGPLRWPWTKQLVFTEGSFPVWARPIGWRVRLQRAW
jgi:hypothetical protein